MLLLLGIVFLPSIWCNQHYVLNLKFSPTGKSPALQMRLRQEEAVFPMRMDSEIVVHLDFYPKTWNATIEGAQGESKDIELEPKRKKKEMNVTAMDTELLLVYFLRCEPNFYGPNCAKRCVSDEDGGWYTCGEMGNKQCRDGWAGQDCSENMITNTTRTLPRTTTQSTTAASENTPTTMSLPASAPSQLESTLSPLMSSDTRQNIVLVIGLFIATVVSILLLAALGCFFYHKKRESMLNKKQFILPTHQKCKVVAVPKLSPLRYVPSPRRTLSFEPTPPKLPETDVPSHYMSQDDLHV